MSPQRLRQINKTIQRTFGAVVLREAEVPPDVLVTISRVETTANLKSAQVWLSVFPAEKAAAIITALQAQLYALQGALNQKLRMYPLPRLILRPDHGALHAATIERRLKKLE